MFKVTQKSSNTQTSVLFFKNLSKHFKTSDNFKMIYKLITRKLFAVISKWYHCLNKNNFSV